MKNRHIKIWEFHEAPEEFQKLSTNGGDENYIAFVPEDMNIPYFLEEGTPFGCCLVEQIEIQNGTILIGSHA